jgi:hypothetical protein
MDDDLNDSILLARKRQDDIDNGEIMSMEDISLDDHRAQGRLVLRRLHARLRLAQFRAIQQMWRPAVKFLSRKIAHLNACGLSCWQCAEACIDFSVSIHICGSLCGSRNNLNIERKIL